RDAGSPAIWPTHAPSAIRWHERHALSIAPPGVDLGWQCHPNPVPLAKVGQIRQEFLIDMAFARADQVVGMDDDADQTMVGGNQLNLCPPQLDRIVAEDMKQRVVLSGRQRQLEDFANEIWHYGAAAATLRFEMCRIRH